MWVVLTRSRTQGGIFTTPGDAYTTPVDMWVKALGEQFFFPPRNQTPVLKKSNLSLHDRDRIFSPVARVTCLLFALFVPSRFSFGGN
jgi:hypothetical protein